MLARNHGVCYTIYAASAFGHVLVCGEAVLLCESAPLPSFFEVVLQFFDPAPGCFHSVNLFLLAVGFQNFFALFIILHSHSIRFGIICFRTSFFARIQNITS